MAFRPSNTLKSRTFVGLLIAQFLAAFNDQAIHAAAMFFALHQGTLTEAQAVNLMPILFYSPWAIFVTLAAYLADRYSKRHSLVFWKVAEVAICALAMFGFWLGSVHRHPAGPIIVLSCVFLMGLHSAFFVPAKYGVMPEILEPQLLSRGNGWLEALSFLAIIIGTVSGGLLSYWFQRRETLIGLVLLVFAVVGAVASLVIETMPAANPTRRFPPWIYQPLWQSLKTLFSVKPLRLAVIGIAFFTFVVAFMRATVYMLGLAQNPPWNEFKTSIIVGMSALGIGIGSPLAGWISGKKIELGLVPLGGLGMIVGVLAGSLALTLLSGTAMLAALVICIVFIGFCTSFYLVPMYTLLQHRAPKTSKGDAVATSNFFNVTGAILASLVSLAVVTAASRTGITPEITDKKDIATGALESLEADSHGRLVFARVITDRGPQEMGKRPVPGAEDDDVFGESAPEGGTVIIKASSRVESAATAKPTVTVSRFDLRDVTHYRIRMVSEPPEPSYDMQPLPRLLFVGAGLITAMTMGVLVWIMPDLPARAAWVVRNFRGTKVAAAGTHHLPPGGPVILAVNDLSPDRQGQLRSATDRPLHFATPATAPDTSRWLAHGDVVAVAVEDVAKVVPQGFDGVVLPVHVGPAGSYVRVTYCPPVTGDADAGAFQKAFAAAERGTDDSAGH
jgi:MFS family permease